MSASEEIALQQKQRSMLLEARQKALQVLADTERRLHAVRMIETHLRATSQEEETRNSISAYRPIPHRSHTHGYFQILENTLTHLHRYLLFHHLQEEANTASGIWRACLTLKGDIFATEKND